MKIIDRIACGENVLTESDGEVLFVENAEDVAIKYAAFEIMKELCSEGRITKEELQYIGEKRKIFAEK